MSTKLLTPERWTPWGEAALRIPDGRTAIIWQGIPGERARITPTGAGNNQVHGRWSGADHPHPHRRDAPCPKVSACGGCPLMHLHLPGQHRARLSMLRAALDFEQVEVPLPQKVVPSPDGDEHYRHVAKLAVGFAPSGETRLGAFGRGTHHVVPIPGCNVVTPTLAKLMSVVARGARDLGLRPFEVETGRGDLRHVVMRQSRKDGRVMITLVTGRGGKLPRELAERIQDQDGAVTGVAMHVNEQPGNAIYAAEPGEAPGFTRLTGTPLLEEELAGVRLRVGPGDFFQANPGTADRIARDLVALLAPWRSHPVVDLYCGVGSFTLVLAQAHGWAFGAEVVPGAVDRARDNALLNHISAEFAHGKVADVLPEMKRRTEGQGPVVMVDPARRGLEDGVIAAIEDLQPAALAYLSCNPRALARDLAIFTRRGWTVRSLQAYDMFPQTAHLETLSLLLPPSAPKVTRRAPQRRRVR